MATVDLQGIDIRVDADNGQILLYFAIIDTAASPPVLVNSGTATLRLFKVTQRPASGRFRIFNWSAGTFDDPADATGANYSTTATHHNAGTSVTQPSGIWVVPITSLDDFDVGAQYIATVNHSTIGEIDPRWFQFDGLPETTKPEEGAFAVTVNLKCGLAAAPEQLCIIRDNDERNFRAGGYTDSDGNFECQLDAGTYKVRFGPSLAYSFENPYTMVVTAAGTKAFTCTAKVQPLRGLTYGRMKGMLQSAFAEYRQTTAGPKYITEWMIEDWVRQGHYRLDARMRWTRAQEDKTTTAETASYEYTVGDLQEITEVHYITSAGEVTLLTRNDPSDRLKWLESGVSGTPTHWCAWDGAIWLTPTPNTTGDTIRLFGVGLPAPLDSDSDIPDLPAQFHDVIVNYAMAMAWRHVGKPDLEEAVLQAVERRMNEARWEPLNERGDSRDMPRTTML